jgi:MFS family permease
VRLRLAGLWRHPDFLKLWAGETVSAFGSEITNLALPLTAVLALRATPAQMGALRAVSIVPALAIGLFAGVWVDRMRRRPILIGTNLGRAVLLATVPLAYALDVLRVEQLYAVVFLTGLLTTFFDTAYFSLLPSLVGKEHLVEGNSKLHLTSSVASIAGPALAGGLMQLVAAPVAILLDAASFVASAAFVGWIRKAEPTPQQSDQTHDIWGEIKEGLHVVLGNPVLKAIAGGNATYFLFSSAMSAVYLLYLARELRLAPVVIGAILAASGPGFLLGSALNGSITRRLGIGRAIVGAALLSGIANLLVPLSAIVPMIGVPLLITAQFLSGFAAMVFSLDQLSLRQAITPDRLLGRMNATMRVISWSAAPAGALLGGVVGQVGLRPALFLAALGTLSAVLWLFFSPLPALRQVPETAEGS